MFQRAFVCVCVVKVIGRPPCTRRIIHDHLHLERQMAGRSQRHLTEGEGVVGSDQRGRWGGSSGPAGASFQWNIFHHWLFLL